MEDGVRRAPSGRLVGAGIPGAPAHRDAAEILAKAEADQASADEARERYRTQALPVLEPDARIGPMLGPEEQVVAFHRSAMLDRRQPVPGSNAPAGLGGDLYVTTRRVVLIGRLTLSFDLSEIDDARLSGERLLLVGRDGLGLSLSVGQPRLLRVEIAAARAGARA